MDLSEISANPHRHPWEMSRADFLMGVMNSHVKLGPNSELLDFGAGDLFFSERIHGASAVKIDAVDQAFDEEGPRNEAIQKIKELHTVLHKKYDAICALDVLEHVENDQEFFNLITGMMKPGATFMVTVPAYQILFSDHDRNLRHFRRYRRSRFTELLKNTPGITMVEGFYFFHTLLYIRIIEKLYRWLAGIKRQPNDEFQSINHWKFPEHHPLTRSLGLFLGTDAWLCRFVSRLGIRVPGLSLCVVLKKDQNG